MIAKSPRRNEKAVQIDGCRHKGTSASVYLMHALCSLLLVTSPANSRTSVATTRIFSWKQRYAILNTIFSCKDLCTVLDSKLWTVRHFVHERRIKSTLKTGKTDLARANVTSLAHQDERARHYTTDCFVQDFAEVNHSSHSWGSRLHCIFACTTLLW